MIRSLLNRWEAELGSDPRTIAILLLALMALAGLCSLSSLGAGPGQ